MYLFVVKTLIFLILNLQAARKAAGQDDPDEGGDIFNEDHDEDLLF